MRVRGVHDIFPASPVLPHSAKPTDSILQHLEAPRWSVLIHAMGGGAFRLSPRTGPENDSHECIGHQPTVGSQSTQEPASKL